VNTTSPSPFFGQHSFRRPFTVTSPINDPRCTGCPKAAAAANRLVLNSYSTGMTTTTSIVVVRFTSLFVARVSRSNGCYSTTTSTLPRCWYSSLSPRIIVPVTACHSCITSSSSQRLGRKRGALLPSLASSSSSTRRIKQAIVHYNSKSVVQGSSQLQVLLRSFTTKGSSSTESSTSATTGTSTPKQFTPKTSLKNDEETKVDKQQQQQSEESSPRILPHESSNSSESQTREQLLFRHWLDQLQSLPNLITLGRMAATPVLSYWIVTHQTWPAIAGCLAAFASDAADGYLARHYHMATTLGTYLDPLGT
jgi:CDP-alcohol phosphatidyltransferase